MSEHPDGPSPAISEQALAALQKFVLRSAQTARLFGVDFLPVVASGVHGVRIEEASPAPAPFVPLPSPAALPAEAKPPAARAAAEVEPLPSASRGAPRQARATAEPAPQSKPSFRVSAAAAQPALLKIDGPAVPLSTWAATVPAAAAIARTREEREAAMNALRAKYEANPPHASFDTPHTTVVWGEGNLCAQLMFVGEAPGEEEDKSGRPFVGRAGQLLDKMIAAIKIDRSGTYIANVLKVRPPNNRTPTPAEVNISSPYLIEQIAIIGPKVVVPLGLPSARLLLASQASMGDLRGKWGALALPDGRVIDVMPTYHPSYVLRSYTEEVRGKVWADLKLALSRLETP